MEDEGEDDSAAAGVRLIAAVRSLALFTMLRGSLCSGAAPPLEVPHASTSDNPGGGGGGGGGQGRQATGGGGHLGDFRAVASALGSPAPLPVKTLAELEIREGSEVALPAVDPGAGGVLTQTADNATTDPADVPVMIPCRVAFEVGRRNVGIRSDPWIEWLLSGFK